MRQVSPSGMGKPRLALILARTACISLQQLLDRKLQDGTIRGQPANCKQPKTRRFQCKGLRTPASTHKHSVNGALHSRRPRCAPAHFNTFVCCSMSSALMEHCSPRSMSFPCNVLIDHTRHMQGRLLCLWDGFSCYAGEPDAATVLRRAVNRHRPVCQRRSELLCSRLAASTASKAQDCGVISWAARAKALGRQGGQPQQCCSDSAILCQQPGGNALPRTKHVSRHTPFCQGHQMPSEEIIPLQTSCSIGRLSLKDGGFPARFFDTQLSQ